MANPDHAAAKIAARQHGLITLHQAVGCGFSRAMARARVRSGLWYDVAPRVYRIAASPFTWYTRVMAQCLASGGLASHRSGPALWDLRDARQGPPEITVPASRNYRHDGVRVHRSSDFDRARPARRHGIPTTGIERTFVDLASVLSADRVEEHVFDAIDKRLTSWDRLHATATAHLRAGRSGPRQLIDVIEKNVGQAVPQSKLEVLYERSTIDAGLIRATRQEPIYDEDGLIVHIDFSYFMRGTLVEIDGRSVHARRLAFSSDASKRDRLNLLGFTFLSFTAEHLLESPTWVVETVANALTADHAIYFERQIAPALRLKMARWSTLVSKSAR